LAKKVLLLSHGVDTESWYGLLTLSSVCLWCRWWWLRSRHRLRSTGRTSWCSAWVWTLFTNLRHFCSLL